MSLFWNLWIIVLTVIAIVLVMWVLLANRKVAKRDDVDQENRTTGHVYDGIEEYDNPLPRWWFQMFILTFIFTVIYLILYPGLGSWPGVLGWTSENRLENEFAKADERYSAMYSDIMGQSIAELADDPRAQKMGVRLFSTHCAVCHGADGGGNFGFPNLTDGEWIWGGSPENIKASITHGRVGQMPAWGGILGEQGVLSVTEYVLQLSGQDHDEALASKGAPLFQQSCAACHMADGTGNPMLGAPSLADSDSWLYSGSREGIAQTIRSGRNGIMPAQAETLREEKIHLLSAYVYNLSQRFAE
ncbi:cytochrome-c oxidase, cbb3-type subunit III [Aurantivibrio plasticivorans]